MSTSPKGFTQIANTDPPDGPAQINGAELFLENLIGESVATSASLPTTGNWPGRLITARNTGIVYVNPAGNTAWKKVNAVDDTGWLTPAMLNGWAAETDLPIRYRRLNGVVYLTGRPAGGSSGVMFTLPTGFRKVALGTSGRYSAVPNGSSPGFFTSVGVFPNGNFTGVSGTHPYLDGVAPYPADA